MLPIGESGQVVKKERKKNAGLTAGSSGLRKKQKIQSGTKDGGSDSDEIREDLLVLAKADGKIVRVPSLHEQLSRCMRPHILTVRTPLFLLILSMVQLMSMRRLLSSLGLR